MIKYFCNRCERPLGEQRGQPFTRFDRKSTRMATVLIMLDGQGEGEICHDCIQDIVLNGRATADQPAEQPAPVATLQQPEPPPVVAPVASEEQLFEPSTPS